MEDRKLKTQGKHCIRDGPNHLFRLLLFLEMNLRELWSPVFFNRFMSAYSYENVFPLLLNQELVWRQSLLPTKSPARERDRRRQRFNTLRPRKFEEPTSIWVSSKKTERKQLMSTKTNCFSVTFFRVIHSLFA